MWILLIVLIEVARFFYTLGFLQSAGYFRGVLGSLLFLGVDWCFFFILIPVLCNYLQPLRFRKGVWLGEWLRKRIKLSIECTSDTELEQNHPYVFACHSHGVIATAELLLFMLRPLSMPELGGYTDQCVATVSSQLINMPLTSVVCRLLGGEPVSRFQTLLRQGVPFAVSPGGAEEISLAHLDTSTQCHILKRTGFLQQCFIENRSIVPLLTLGNHTMYRVAHGLKPLQWLTLKLLGYGMPLLAFGWYGTVVPLASASVKIIRLDAFRPIEGETFDQYSTRYYAGLTKVAQEHGVTLHTLSREQLVQMLAT